MFSLLKVKYRIKYATDVTFNYIIDTGQSRWNMSHTLFKQTDEYYSLRKICLLSTTIHGGIKIFIIIVGKQILDNSVTFELPLNCKDVDECFTGQFQPKVTNSNKVARKSVRFFSYREKYVFFQEINLMYECCMLKYFTWM